MFGNVAYGKIEIREGHGTLIFEIADTVSEGIWDIVVSMGIGRNDLRIDTITLTVE